MEEKNIYAKGDWVVHINYGVGQVIGLEKKCLGEKDILYYRIEGGNGIFWLPVKKADTERVRPIVSKKRLHKAIRALRERPQEMDKNHKVRQRMLM